MFLQKGWGTKPFNSCIKKKVQRICCNGTKEDQTLTLFEYILCHCSKWSSTQHRVVLLLCFFKSTILSYLGQTSAFRTTAGLSCTQAGCTQGTGHCQAAAPLSLSPWQDTFTSQLQRDPAPPQEPAAARDEGAVSRCCTAEGEESCAVSRAATEFLQMLKKGCPKLWCFTFISELEERQRVLLRCRQHPTEHRAIPWMPFACLHQTWTCLLF